MRLSPTIRTTHVRFLLHLYNIRREESCERGECEKANHAGGSDRGGGDPCGGGGSCFADDSQGEGSFAKNTLQRQPQANRPRDAQLSRCSSGFSARDHLDKLFGDDAKLRVCRAADGNLRAGIGGAESVERVHDDPAVHGREEGLLILQPEFGMLLARELHFHPLDHQRVFVPFQLPRQSPHRVELLPRLRRPDGLSAQ